MGYGKGKKRAIDGNSLAFAQALLGWGAKKLVLVVAWTGIWCNEGTVMLRSLVPFQTESSYLCSVYRIIVSMDFTHKDMAYLYLLVQDFSDVSRRTNKIYFLLSLGTTLKSRNLGLIMFALFLIDI